MKLAGESLNTTRHLPQLYLRMPQIDTPEVSSKALGDAGEYFALSQFTFAGLPASKMPDCWPGYDLVVESGRGLVKVSVKTRRETLKWKSAPWFIFDERIICDWIVFLFLPLNGSIRSWILPFEIAREFGNKPLSTRKDPHNRDMSFAKLNREPLIYYEGNWNMLHLNNSGAQPYE